MKRLLIALTLLCTIGIAQSNKPAAPVIGVQLYSFRNEMKTDVDGVLAKVKAMGFTEVEAAGYNWNSAAEFKQMLDKHGLKNVSFFADYNKLSSDFAAVVADAKALNAKYVIIGWIPHKGNDFTLADTEKAIKDFNDWGARLAKEGLKFAYHVHGYEFQTNGLPAGQGTLFDKLMKETDPKNVLIELDVYWIQWPGQDPVKVLKKLGNRVHLLHLKELPKGMKGDLTGHSDVESNIVVGTGQIDFPTLMKVAKQVGVKHYFIEDESSRSMTQVPESLKYLKSLK
jgi:sugar phosphate isomerase/epimerase